MLMVYVFPSQHSSQTAVFIQKGGEGETERKDGVLGMTSLCLVCFGSNHRGRTRWAVKATAGWRWGVRKLMRFVRYGIFRLSALLPPHSHSQSILTHCAEHWIPYNSAVGGRLDLGA